jgi:beta-N-acetylhexosaminidase
VKRKAIIIGIRGLKLSPDEIYLLKKEKPWGVILFSRNIKNLFQLEKLIIDIKNCVKDKNYPILIDQEGGRVSRLNKISEIIKKVGININTVPVLDVRRKDSHSIIGNRSFSNNPSIVSKIGNLCINLYNKNKIATVIKHIPGHGLSKCDSHHKLPVINNKKNVLIKKDFKPFKNCNSHFAMTAHVIYSVYDPINTATHSRIVINEIIRKHIGFRGILISDDISMKALRYGLRDNAIKALDAGCNLILHCNGNMQEMRKLTKIIPTIDKFTQKKTSHFYNFLR